MIVEVPNEVDNIPRERGVYIFYDKDWKILYVGKSFNVYCRIKQHLPSNDRWNNRCFLLIDENIEKVKFIHIIITDDISELEFHLIRILNPPFNKAPGNYPNYYDWRCYGERD